MKCIKKDDIVMRVKDSQAQEQVKAGWAYCSKRIWKDKRVPVPAVAVSVVSEPVTPEKAEEKRHGDKKARWRRADRAKKESSDTKRSE